MTVVLWIRLLFLNLTLDADPGQQNPCVEAAREKGMVRPLSQEESTSTLALTGFYCFSGHITLRMVLFTMHRFAVTENKGEGVANYIKEEGYLQM